MTHQSVVGYYCTNDGAIKVFGAVAYSAALLTRRLHAIYSTDYTKFSQICLYTHVKGSIVNTVFTHDRVSDL